MQSLHKYIIFKKTFWEYFIHPVISCSSLRTYWVIAQGFPFSSLVTLPFLSIHSLLRTNLLLDFRVAIILMSHPTGTIWERMTCLGSCSPICHEFCRWNYLYSWHFPRDHKTNGDGNKLHKGDPTLQIILTPLRISTLAKKKYSALPSFSSPSFFFFNFLRL